MAVAIQTGHSVGAGLSDCAASMTSRSTKIDLMRSLERLLALSMNLYSRPKGDRRGTSEQSEGD